MTPTKHEMPEESMAVSLTEWLYELFCESQSIDMNDIQEKMVDLGIIDASEATEDDCDHGFDGDIGDMVFHKTAAYKKQKSDLAARPVEITAEQFGPDLNEAMHSSHKYTGDFFAEKYPNGIKVTP